MTLYVIYLFSVLYIKFALKLDLDNSANVCITAFVGSFMIKIINWLCSMVTLQGMSTYFILVDAFTSWALVIVLYYFTFEMNAVY